MANILFGDVKKTNHDAIIEYHKCVVENLSKTHEVTYVLDEKEMLFELTRAWMEVAHKQHDLIVCNTKLFCYVGDLEQRAVLFEERVIDYLKIGKAPVIVLADEEIAGKIQQSAVRAGFFFATQPYRDMNLSMLITDILNKSQYSGCAL